MIFTKLKLAIEQRFEHWLIKRMPAVDNVTLHRGNTFIFPSRFGMMFIATCTVMFLIGTNYENNLILFLVFFLLSFMVVCLLISYQNLSGLTLTAIKPENQFADKECTFVLRVNTERDLAQQTNYFFKQRTSLLASVISDGQIKLFAKSSQRGWFIPGRVTIRSDFPFGLFNVWTHLDFGFRCLLYPTPIENVLATNTLKGTETDSGRSQTKVGFENFSGLKSFQQGESLKSVAWKQVAQGRGWFTKEFEQEQGGEIYLSFSDFMGISTEDVLSMLTYQVLNYEQQGIKYALDLGTIVISANVGSEHQQQCLSALALYGQHNA